MPGFPLAPNSRVNPRRAFAWWWEKEPAPQRWVVEAPRGGYGRFLPTLNSVGRCDAAPSPSSYLCLHLNVSGDQVYPHLMGNESQGGPALWVGGLMSFEEKP